jgi:hypothetical protein
MPFTYDPQLLSSLDQVRFLIGDTDVHDPQLDDDEVLYLLTENNGAVRAAATAAIDALIAKYARQVDKWVGDLKILASQRYEQYVALRDTLVEGGGSPVLMGIPTAGGVYAAENEVARLNTALVPSLFRKGMHDNT